MESNSKRWGRVEFGNTEMWNGVVIVLHFTDVLTIHQRI